VRQKPSISFEDSSPSDERRFVEGLPTNGMGGFSMWPFQSSAAPTNIVVRFGENSMTSADEQIQRAINAAEEVNHGGTNFKFLYRHPRFLRGELYVIGFNEGERKCENFVFFKGNSIRVAKNSGHLVDLANQESEVSPLARAAAEFVSVSSLIAILLTAAICYLVIVQGKENKDIPAILSTSLSTIIGFYFGTKARKST